MQWKNYKLMGNQKQQNFVAIGYFWLIQQTLSYSLLRLFVTDIDILARLFFAPLLAAPGFNHHPLPKGKGREEGEWPVPQNVYA